MATSPPVTPPGQAVADEFRALFTARRTPRACAARVVRRHATTGTALRVQFTGMDRSNPTFGTVRRGISRRTGARRRMCRSSATSTRRTPPVAPWPCGCPTATSRSPARSPRPRSKIWHPVAVRGARPDSPKRSPSPPAGTRRPSASRSPCAPLAVLPTLGGTLGDGTHHCLADRLLRAHGELVRHVLPRRHAHLVDEARHVSFSRRKVSSRSVKPGAAATK